MIRIRRTLGSGPPPSMEFGELAYSDTDSQLYVGRPDGPPMVFDDQNHTHEPPAAALVPFPYVGNFQDFDANRKSQFSVSGNLVILDIFAANPNVGAAGATIIPLGPIPPELAPRIHRFSVFGLFGSVEQNGDIDDYCLIFNQGNSIWLYREFSWPNDLVFVVGQVIWVK